MQLNVPSHTDTSQCSSQAQVTCITQGTSRPTWSHCVTHHATTTAPFPTLPDCWTRLKRNRTIYLFIIDCYRWTISIDNPNITILYHLKKAQIYIFWQIWNIIVHIFFKIYSHLFTGCSLPVYDFLLQFLFLTFLQLYKFI